MTLAETPVILVVYSVPIVTGWSAIELLIFE